jgi:adenylate cyclase
MKESKISEDEIKNVWFTYLTTGNMAASVHAPWYDSKSVRPFVKYLPRSPRCGICYFPFRGIGGFLSRTLLGIEESKLNPHLCNLCERFATKYHGGVEIETAVIFVDMRNSTQIAEQLSAEEFSRKINRFYGAVTEVFYKNNGLVEKFQGDEIGGFFVPGISGPQFVAHAIKTGKQALKALGYNASSGPWLQAGIGIHTGITYVGSVTASGGVTDISVLGDTVNVAARLTSQAASGEIIISEATLKASGISQDKLEHRVLTLKGKTGALDAWVIKV